MTKLGMGAGLQLRATVLWVLFVTLVFANASITSPFPPQITRNNQALLRLRGGSRVPTVPQRRQRILNERLWKAAKNGNSERCQALIRKGAEIESESIDGGADPANYFYDLYGFTFYEENENRAAGGERAPSQKPPKRKAAARTALRWAAYKGEAHTVSTLLALGATVNSEDPDGWTALHEAALYGHTEVVRALLARDANVNLRTHSSWTPLHLAAAYGHLEIVQLLHEDGADIVKVTDGGLTPMDWAKAYGMTEVTDFLRTCSGRRHGACETCGRSNFFVQGGIATKISNM